MKNIIITGCGNSKTLGYHIANAIAVAMHDVCIISIGIDEPSSLQVNKHIHLDLCSDGPEFERAYVEVANFIDGYGVYALINCAGLNSLQWFENLDFNTFDKIHKVNLRAPIMLTKLFLDDLSAVNGTVLNIISKGAHQPFRTSLAYNTSKAAMSMATKQLARELTPSHGITIFGISPNELKDTNLTLQIEEQVKEVRGWSHEHMKSMQVGATLNGKITPPEKLAEFIAFLLKDKANHEMLSGAEIQYGI